MRFLIKATIKPGTDKAEVLSRVPAANAASEERVKQGIQEGAALVAADRSAGWAVINCKSREELQEIFQTMPLNDFQEYEVTLLLEEKDN